jgi:hypothetical protein
MTLKLLWMKRESSSLSEELGLGSIGTVIKKTHAKFSLAHKFEKMKR